MPAYFLAISPEIRTFWTVPPFASHDRALSPSDYNTEDTMPKTQKWTASTFVSLVHENLTEKGHKVKKSDLNWAVKDAFEAAVAAGARGMRVRFPEIGALASRDVKARKAGKGTNPFTGESIMLKARPASKKPRWSFPKAVREAYIRTAARKAA
jgi:nucleoid DNA-binding protein